MAASEPPDHPAAHSRSFEHPGRDVADPLQKVGPAADDRYALVLVHLHQVPGEEVGLLSPLGPAQLDDHVAVVVGVARQQKDPQLLLQPFDRLPCCGGLGPPPLALIAARRGQQLLGRGQVVGRGPQRHRGLDHRLKRPVPARHLGVAAVVRDHLGIGQTAGWLHVHDNRAGIRDQ